MKAESSLSFLDKIQQSLDSFFVSFNLTAKDVMVYVTCFAIGFGAGLLFRRYGMILVTGLIAIAIVLAAFQYFDFIVINHSYIRCLLGMQDIQSFSDSMQFAYALCMRFLIEIILVVVAFLVGFKLG